MFIIVYHCLLLGKYIMEELFTVEQAAKALKVHHITVRRYIKEGKLKALRAGGNVRLSAEAIKSFTQSFVPKIKTTKAVSAEANFSFDDPLFRLKARGLG